MAPSAVETAQVNGATPTPTPKPANTVGNAFTRSAANGADPQSDDASLQPTLPEEFEYPPMSTPYRLLNQYHSKPTKLRVACVGAGASGLCVIYKMVS